MRPLALFVLLTSSSLLAQRPQLRAEWISQEGAHVAEVPQTFWLRDDTAILYDTRKPEADWTFERLDPATGQREPLLNASPAITSLRSLLPGSEAPSTLTWPLSFDPEGTKAVYVWSGDIFLLDFASSSFTRVTTTASEEKDPEFSPKEKGTYLVRTDFPYEHLEALGAIEPINAKETSLKISAP